MYCRHCKKRVMLGAKRCQHCGKMLNSSGEYDFGDSYGKNGKGAVGLIIAGALAVLLVLGILIALPAISGREEPSLDGRGNDVGETIFLEEEEYLVKETEPEEEDIQSVVTEPTETQPAQTEPVLTMEEFSIYSYQELKDILAPNCITRRVDVTFQYLGNEGVIDFEELCCILSARAASVTDLGSGKFRIIAEPYAGARILEAYRNGTTANLTSDEQEALRIAESVVDWARKEASSDLELELLLHDWMCENISYYDVDFSIEFTEKRPLNVIGALLDGKANCQGYTDCFYLLGNMAGFVVDKQSYPEHTFNTIKLGGQWYMMDVTHDDAEMEVNGELYHYYQHFNASHSDSDGRSWKPWTERNPIAQTTGTYFYYEQQDLGYEHDYQKTFYNLQDAAKSILAEYQEGRMVHQALVRGITADYEDMNNALSQEANRLGVKYSVWTFYFDKNGNTYFFICFE